MNYYEYRDTYYGEDYEEVEIPEYTPGPTPGDVTREEVEAMITEKLNTIHVNYVDEDTVTISVDGVDTDPINDVYVTDAEQIKEGDESYVRFSRSSGREPLVVPLSEFEDPVLDCKTF